MNDDFTVARYHQILERAKQKFRFVTFLENLAEPNIALWRHDIDFSPHRALAMAQIEANMGVCATYFIQLSSRFYNVFEPEVSAIIRKIGLLGHHIGIHLDTERVDQKVIDDHVGRLAFEAGVLEKVAEKRVKVFSLHNPSTMIGISFDERMHSGLYNASHSKLRDEFAYCSDSNGIWRYRDLESMISDAQINRLYVLTHPEWWQAISMSPRDRIQRCMDGRANYGARYYDDLLRVNNRPNIGSKK